MVSSNSLYGPLQDPAADAGYEEPPKRLGFFTDTSICIGCKACEVACKEWNAVPEDGLNLLGYSYDNTGGLGADSWRAVHFIEQPLPIGTRTPPFEHTPTGPSGVGPTFDVVAAGSRAADASRLGTAGPGSVPVAETAAQAAREAGVDTAFLGMPGSQPPGNETGLEERTDFRWLMMSNVCKHCTHAACLDVCPTGSLFRTEFGTVVVQQDICNGCGYCVSACPYGVIDKREDDGRAWKCTLCYDRLGADMTPACAKACPTESIQFGELEELRERAEARVEQLHANGVPEARLYGNDPDDGVGGDGAFFLLLDEPEVYGLPPDPVVTTRDLPDMWKHAGAAAALMVLGAAASFLRTGRRR
ncbi:formate dehydrogenase iron-sulfur subunit [Motilibacter rhizosphaerae]|uniref:Formate dehydrogenase iron-sulfur subunit n=1 Tax=Motilibacter rhizosphaerae TaxID=598652 RepID=A0A4Q7NUT3_9ACTN|nr:4Fe-4S dicluster domain-containing protein [Motilibacter rhizosphaerae]RZS90971.1 formate dehydrogenase iron-sulfur subunit [Motilibacter rhizosphaerae]